MLSSEEVYARRFGSIRPGLALVAVEKAALPVTLVKTDVLAQERKAIPLLSEFVLRITAGGLNEPAQIAELCGLDPSLVDQAIAEQADLGNLTYSATARKLALTTYGRTAVLELESVQPVETEIELPFDRLTWDLADYRPRDLLKRQLAEDEGMLLLPAANTRRISVDDVSVSRMNALLRSTGDGARKLEVLLAKRVRPDVHRYLPVDLLVFAHPDGSEVGFAVLVGDDLSERHSTALEGQGGAAAIGIVSSPNVERPLLSSELEALRTRETIELDESQPEATLATESGVKSVAVFEHRLLLFKALAEAKTRLLIISPWIKSAVVDVAFLGLLEQRLEQGVTVHIGHGIGKDDRGSDPLALERLQSLSARYAKRFKFVRLPNTHAKILIWDGSWVTTSFNWLSFRGDPNRTYRMEEGTIVTLPGHVDRQYDKYVEFLLESEN